MSDEVQRVVGLIEETNYGVVPTSGSPAVDSGPDFHMEIEDSSIKIEGDPLKLPTGSRGTKIVRPGTYLPSPEHSGVVDLKQIGHYLKGVLGDYEYTAGTPGSPGTANIHEFWGGEKRKLPSFTLYGHFDEFIKRCQGTIIQSISMEVSNEFLKFTAKCVSQKDTMIKEMPAAAELKTIEGIVPLAFYDVALEFDGEVPPGIVSSLKWEVSNDIKTDDAFGIGNSRFMLIKPTAGARTNTLEMEVSLEPETVKYIEMFEYGEEGASAPSNCKIAKVPIKITLASICDNPLEKLTIYFPDCMSTVEYSASGSDAIKMKLAPEALKTTNVELEDGVTEVQADVYCKLENLIPEIVPGGVDMIP
jgi:hypothetical protein